MYILINMHRYIKHMYICIVILIAKYRCLFIFNVIVSVEEWKGQLSPYLIDYNSLDIKETIASGLWMCSH